MTQTQPRGVTWCRPSRALAMVFVLAALLATSMVAADGGAGSTDVAGSEVGVLAPSMVEMLDYDATSTPMTLEEVRKAVEGYLGTKGVDGSGIDVALIDTGVAPVVGLDGDKVLHGPDLSFEGSTPEVAYLDTYGHGTHMAGIIAGDRAGHEGIAPGARIISLKTAGHDGITTVPQVIAAIDWVIEHRNSDGLNIRVLNLSLGQRGVDDHVGDHLSAAVERAWDAGIFVVVAAGNRGETQKHLDSPAIDPYVLAVGAHDLYAVTETEPVKTTTFTSLTTDTSRTLRAVGTVERRGGVPEWSANGDGDRNPDMIAAGRSIASYRVPGSTIDRQAPAARYGDDLFLGSGTSQSAAVTSGMAALLFQAHPSLTPDQMKATVTRTAGDLSVPAERDGNGVLRGYQAGSVLDIKDADQKHPAAAGPGSGIVLPSGATWSGGSWSGATWSGGSWSGATWSGATWSGATWSGATWSGATWSGATWSGATWSGATWSGDGWQ